MQDWQPVYLGIFVIGGLAISGWLNHYYVNRGENGCIALPVQCFVMTATVFFATSIGAGGIQVWLGWRLFGAVIVGLGSSVGMYRARQIVDTRRQKG